MADISKEELRKEITAILKDADLTTMSAKKVRQQIEEKLDVDLTDRKKEVDDLVMECLQEKQDGKGKDSGKKKKNKEKDEEDEEEDEEEEEEDEDEEEEEEEEEKPKPKRGGGATTKKPPAKKAKKTSSDESDEGSDDDVSDEEYSPSKKGKNAPAKKGKTAKKKKGSDSDSDEDWAKTRKSNSGGGAGGGGGGGAAKKVSGGKRGAGSGYTRAYTLSPELAAVVGADAMARHEVVRKIWAIIKEKNLYDPKNKQFAICNDELLKVFGVKRFRTFGMMKYLKNHFID
ncbi:upstream activation factor subunit spp27 [Zootermopsis nevadensis]|uniref:Upstream activation factor subunit spp27 n=1 Tax=Zootermopsis nevadensis TaxID=136037 RepID=A0A067R6X1_ZOONE|nr:upstream activation factor subunit spp27 [Zootermopsis nevadensis]KDR14042.1 Upstream activation factor subunit spp27 [Zootermopsis nevadensis]